MSANSTVSAGSTAGWKDRKRYLWLIGLVVPSLAFIGYGLWALTGWGLWFWIGPIVILVVVPAIDLVAGLDRSNPPDDVIEALEQDRYYRWITYLFLPVQYAGFVGAMWLIAGGADLAVVDKVGLARLHRLHRRHRRSTPPTSSATSARRTSAGSPRSRWRRASTATSTSSTTAATTSGSRRPRTRRRRGSARDFYQFWPRTVRRLAEVGLAPGEAALRTQEAAPVPDRQRRAQRVADVARAVGRADRLARHRDPAVPDHPGGRGLLAARGRQLHGALRDAAPEGRRRRAAALRAGRPDALVELQQHRDQRAALPPAAAQRPPRQPDPALPVAARLRGVAGAADRVRRDDRARRRTRRLAPGDGPASAGALRRRPVEGKPVAAQAGQDPGEVPRSGGGGGCASNRLDTPASRGRGARCPLPRLRLHLPSRAGRRARGLRGRYGVGRRAGHVVLPRLRSPREGRLPSIGHHDPGPDHPRADRRRGRGDDHASPGGPASPWARSPTGSA